MKTVMWLEDDEYFMRKIMRPIEELGYEVKMYGTAAAFLADLPNVPSSDLVLIDLLVPSGENQPEQRYAGLRVLRAVATVEHAPPVLVFSVVGSSEALRDAKKYTPHIMTKPARLTDFTAKVKDLLSTRGLNRGTQGA